MTMVLPTRGMAFFMAPFRRQSEQTELDLPEHLFWVLIGRTASFGRRLRSASSEELRQEALERVRGWHPLLGDAIHTMTPLQGLGGNTALVDAALLAQQLVEVDRGRLTIAEAIGSYEARMRSPPPTCSAAWHFGVCLAPRTGFRRYAM
jgi:2-polyprenyl-6-methoxyphenol hydroxylase-like FAD-dependent oxidoreductase